MKHLEAGDHEQMNSSRKIFLGFVILIAAAEAAHAEEPTPKRTSVISPEYGLTLLDLNADGEQDIILRTRWENGNAHSFDRYTLAIVQTSTAGQHITHEVPLAESSQSRIQTNEGAECLRTGYVFRLNNERRLEVVEYRLTEGVQTYCEATLMTTTLYRLEHTEGEVGLPPFYLRQIEQKRSSERFTDVSAFIP
jgi:hypothetical protein